MTLLVTVNKKLRCNVAFINVINKVIVSKAFISIFVVSFLYILKIGTIS